MKHLGNSHGFFPYSLLQLSWSKGWWRTSQLVPGKSSSITPRSSLWAQQDCLSSHCHHSLPWHRASRMLCSLQVESLVQVLTKLRKEILSQNIAFAIVDGFIIPGFQSEATHPSSMPRKPGNTTLLLSIINPLWNHSHLQHSPQLCALIHLSSGFVLNWFLSLKTHKLLEHFFSCWLDAMECHYRFMLKIHKLCGLNVLITEECVKS